ncbi:helix-turn-helix domain-containing protein [Chitinophaga sp. YR573]|uniref:helix-turn-helix domain-containing protein n=1 Tax=Chitinophaga sp. YR573 TaxID=1881040 RepID=UPI0015A5CF42|nr:helix-turn-helix transcriptional regulator [Chitinophaga sp. YR573]
MLQQDEQKIIKQFGRRIRTLRKERGWSISDLSHEGELDAGYLGKVERGKVNPGLIYITALARAFEMEIWDLLKY